MAGRGSHYCVDFGPFPGPTAAGLKGPVEVESVPQGEFPRSAAFSGLLSGRSVTTFSTPMAEEGKTSCLLLESLSH